MRERYEYTGLDLGSLFRQNAIAQRGQRDELRIKMAPGGKALIMPVFMSTPVADVYAYVADKEWQQGFELTYKRNTWSESELWQGSESARSLMHLCRRTG